MERWMQRQLGQEGERLHQLRQRLWKDVRWGRQDRVLVLGGRSLLWALDPLQQVPEGGVTLLCPDDDDRRRIAAQIQLLDPELQPQLLSNLADLPLDHRFERIGGRLGSADLQNLDWGQFAEALTRCAEGGSELRLLLSTATVGPAGALNSPGLERLVHGEQQWLTELEIELDPLEQRGWLLHVQAWEEMLTLPGGPALADRWLAENSAYRRMIRDIDADMHRRLRQMLDGVGANGLRLPLRHQLIAGRLQANKKAPAEPGLG